MKKSIIINLFDNYTYMVPKMNIYKIKTKNLKFILKSIDFFDNYLYDYEE